MSGYLYLGLNLSGASSLRKAIASWLPISTKSIEKEILPAEALYCKCSRQFCKSPSAAADPTLVFQQAASTKVNQLIDFSSKSICRHGPWKIQFWLALQESDKIQTIYGRLQLAIVLGLLVLVDYCLRVFNHCPGSTGASLPLRGFHQSLACQYFWNIKP